MDTFEQIKEENYTLLAEHLRQKGQYLSKKEFIAMLNVMEGMTIYRKTKKDAVRDTSAKFPVTKKFLLDMLAELDFKSSRYLESRKEYGRYQAIATQQHKQVMKTV